MPFNVLLLPLLGGYVFITKWNRTRFHTKRDTGERLLFHAGLAGVVMLVAAFVLAHVTSTITPGLHDAWSRAVPFPYAGTSLLALVLGCAVWRPANFLYPRAREARRVLREWGDHLEILFDRALTENRQLSVTLKGGKVYVGFVLENFDPSYDRKFITILPIASGHRNTADHTMVLTTSYSEVYLKIRSHRTGLQSTDFQIVIPVAEVQSANLFDWDAFDEFQSMNELFEAATPEHAHPGPAPAQFDETSSPPASMLPLDPERMGFLAESPPGG